MKFIPTKIPDVVLIEPKLFGDDRGFFMETWRRDQFECAGINIEFVQENHSRSHKGVLRGLHYQINHAQGKLVRVLKGEVYDVAVDMRRNSKSFGKWVAEYLTEENKRQMWIPPGFAHGFLVLSETVDFVYKCSEYYAPHEERTLLWNDEQLSIKWPSEIAQPILSKKDAAGVPFSNAEFYT